MIPFILPLKHALKLPLYYRVAGGSYYHRPQHARLLLDVGISPPPFHMYKSPSLPFSYASEITLHVEYLLQSHSPRSLGSR